MSLLTSAPWRVKCVPNTFQPSRDPRTGRRRWNCTTNNTRVSGGLKRVQEHVSTVNTLMRVLLHKVEHSLYSCTVFMREPEDQTISARTRFLGCAYLRTRARACASLHNQIIWYSGMGQICRTMHERVGCGGVRAQATKVRTRRRIHGPGMGVRGPWFTHRTCPRGSGQSRGTGGRRTGLRPKSEIADFPGKHAP